MLQFAQTIGGVGQKLLKVKLGNSQTFEVGDVVDTYNSGVADLAGAAQPILGVIVSFVDEQGIPLPDSTVAAGSETGVTQRSVTTDASNSDGYYAMVDVSEDAVYSAEVSGTLGTNNDSDLPGCKIDINSAGSEYGQVLESTATRAVATTANFYSLGKDPRDSSRLLVKIASSELRADANTEA